MYNDFYDCNTAAQVQEKARRKEREDQEKQKVIMSVENISRDSNSIVNQHKEIIRHQEEEIKELKFTNRLQTKQLMLLNDIFSNQELNSQVQNQVLELLTQQYAPTHPIWQQIKEMGKNTCISIFTEATIIAIKQILSSKGINV